MNSCFKIRRLRGFTLVELLVVVAIMSLMLTFAANLLKGTDTTKGLQSGVDLLNSTITEAREIAKGRATWTRVVIPVEPDNKSLKSRHLRFAAVMAWESSDPMNLDLKPMGNDTEWKMQSKGVEFPDGVYFSPELSQVLDNEGISDGGKPISSRKVEAQISGGKVTDCYYLEFDRLGRLTWPRGLTKVVMMVGARRQDGSILPAPRDEAGRPQQASGLMVFPNGETSYLRNKAQVFGSLK